MSEKTIFSNQTNPKNPESLARCRSTFEMQCFRNCTLSSFRSFLPFRFYFLSLQVLYNDITIALNTAHHSTCPRTRKRTRTQTEPCPLTRRRTRTLSRVHGHLHGHRHMSTDTNTETFHEHVPQSHTWIWRRTRVHKKGRGHGHGSTDAHRFCHQYVAGGYRLQVTGYRHLRALLQKLTSTNNKKNRLTKIELCREAVNSTP